MSDSLSRRKIIHQVEARRASIQQYQQITLRVQRLLVPAETNPSSLHPNLSQIPDIAYIEHPFVSRLRTSARPLCPSTPVASTVATLYSDYDPTPDIHEIFQRRVTLFAEARASISSVRHPTDTGIETTRVNLNTARPSHEGSPAAQPFVESRSNAEDVRRSFAADVQTSIANFERIRASRENAPAVQPHRYSTSTAKDSRFGEPEAIYAVAVESYIAGSPSQSRAYGR